ncbi:Crp/Fnr family transcriptional regulator [Tropicimonas sp. IMCC34043]|uniref:Crp/Fnr family transcriptional regulator n=1 Tax=Tropicimonas sp. IMCC34043 TaxID=2248760 RepID=UPI000E225AE4|nr:Crp/Fnr family transcriptional regulator [Tropicimonas sp. IMCC34043]
MSLDCTECPLRRKSIFLPFTDQELSFMERFKSGEMFVDAGTQLFVEGASAAQLYTVLSGMGIRYKTLENGRRQVVNFAMPGDFLGLQAAVMGEMRHSVEASTPMRLCVFNRSRVYELFENHPRRAYSLTYLAAVEENFLGDALATIGQRSALEKIAWSLHRFFVRNQALGLEKDGTCSLPFRQQDLADALGLSLVHTNKTLARLRDRQIARWHDARLEVFDLDALAQIGLVDEPDAEDRPLI